uniref:GDSL esterase/lipase n=1 Tax=Aegilops tauschii TaxID=37682 RepID=M8BFR5_AEGTA
MAHQTNGYLQSYSLDPYVVLTHSYGLQGAFGYWVQPMGDEAGGMPPFPKKITGTGNLCTSGKPTAITFTQPPYGETYFGTPTCRCSDDRVIVDFLSTKFGVPFLPPSKANGTDFKQGANMAITGAPAMDAPFFRGLSLSDKCNDLSTFHNNLLQAKIARLRKRYARAARIMYAEFYSAVYDMVQNPKKYGFNAVFEACCGSGGGKYNYANSARCGMQGATACANPADHLSWDSIHLTEAAYKHITDGWLNGPYCSPPIPHT